MNKLEKKNIFVTIVLILLLAGIVWLAVKLIPIQQDKLVSPIARKVSITAATVPTLSPPPAAVINNPPAEIHYGAATNLKKELDSINPQVLDSDFE